MVKLRVLLEQSSLGELEDDGFWTVVSTIKQSYQEENAEWITKSISVKSIDKDKERAYRTSAEAVSRQFEALDFNLFSVEDSDGSRDALKVNQDTAT